MRAPLELGDNFPVASWSPTIPWRFPRNELFLKKRSFLHGLLPWVTLGLGVTLGILWMTWKMELPVKQPGGEGPEGGVRGVREEVLRPAVAPARVVPASAPTRSRSRLA